MTSTTNDLLGDVQQHMYHFGKVPNGAVANAALLGPVGETEGLDDGQDGWD